MPRALARVLRATRFARAFDLSGRAAVVVCGKLVIISQLNPAMLLQNTQAGCTVKVHPAVLLILVLIALDTINIIDY